MNKHLKNLIYFIPAITLMSCFGDLDTIPLDPTVTTAATVYDDPKAYKQVLAKVYAGYSVSGQQGPAGQADISGIDEGFGQYLRGFWYHQELSTDEALIGWNDQTIKDFHHQTWTEQDGFIYAFYSRVFYQIALANEFLRETTEEKLTSRNVDDATKAEVRKYRAEVRYLRALSYWHGLDIFRNPPFATEESVVGSVAPRQGTAQEVFDFIASELQAIEPELAEPRANEYGRADKGAAWMLLAKLYLNAEVYVGQNKYADCLALCKQLINGGYSLDPVYKNLFLADNHKSKEIIFPVTFDGINTRTWGGTTFIIRAGIGGSMNPQESGVVSGWGGTRTTKQFVEKFPADLTGILVDFNQGKTVTYPKLYIPGSHQGFNYDSLKEHSLASALSNKVFEGYEYFPSPNTEILFTQIQSASAPKFGDNGADGKLETNGEKIKVANAGLHYIRVDLNAAKSYIIEPRSWVANGSATGGQDITLTYDPALRVLKSIKVQLTNGTFVFRESGGTTLGDTGSDAILDIDGTSISITKNGGYQIFLDVDKPDYTYQVRFTDFDRRGMFYTKGQSLEINDVSRFVEGYAINKFKNVTSTGALGSDNDFPDTDFPMFRLGDVYLMAAECILRNGGSKQEATDYFNKVRERSYEGQAGNIAANDLTLDMLLDERARELYWECHRRTDLVRYGKFTDGNYVWAWKGNVAEGATVPSFRNIYPIPSADLISNTNLQQNPGY